MPKKTLIINFGSTSTKIAVFEDSTEIFKETISHSMEELSQFPNVWDQAEFREEKILSTLKAKNCELSSLDGIAVRGGTLKPIPGGIYILNEEMISDMKSGKYGEHPSNIGNEIAYKLGKKLNIPAIVADPPVTDELSTLAKYSGIKGVTRVSSFHALNHKRTARQIAKELGREYEDLNLIVIHMGGGISVGVHEKGLVVDVNNSLDGDGSFSPERAGTIAASSIINMCFSGEYTKEDMFRKVKGGGGLMSYLNTNSGLEVEERIDNGDGYAREVYEAMAYQVSKEIGAASAALSGKVDGIVMTGSLSNSKRLVEWIKERVSFIAPIYLKPGENEMLSLAENAVRFLNGEVEAKEY